MPLPQDGRRAAVRRRRAPGVLGWMAAAGWLLLAAPVGAAALQPVLEARTELRSFAIAAGPLAQVIAQYANQAGVALSFDAAQIGARRSPGLQGRYSVQDGFARLLEGTDLQAQRESSGVYTLRLQPLQTSQLDNVIVSAKAQIDATTESSGSYAAGRVTANIGQQLVRDIPQPVTVLTRQWLDDQALPDLHAVLRNTTGVTVDYIDSERINYYARGYQIDSLQVDGLGINQVTSAATFIQPDTAMLDRVEVLRGASGLLRGAGNPSAVVNMVRKRPTPAFQGAAALTLGSWNRQRLEADLSGPINAAGTLRARLVALSDDKASFQTARHEDRQSIYAVIEADLAPATRLTASVQHTSLGATGSWGGLPAALDGSQLDLPRNTYLGTTWNAWNRSNRQLFVELDHGLDNGWKLKAQAARTYFRSDGFKQTSFTSASDTNPYLADVNTSIYDGEASSQSALSLQATGPFALLGRQHELALGVDLQRVRAIGTSGYWDVSPLRGVDIRSWNPYTSYPEPVYSAGNGNPYSAPTSHVHQHGGFARARLSLSDALTAVVGARLSWWDYHEPATPGSGYGVRHELTPYAGLIHELSDHISAYASYSKIFSSQNKKQTNGNLLTPIRGQDLEAGFKGDFLDGRLQGTLSAFHIQYVGGAMEDTASPMPCLPYYLAGRCYLAGGKSRSRGWEVELSGEPAPGWQLMASYTNTHTRYLRDAEAALVGQPLRSADPRHALRLFASHKLAGPWPGWTVGAGLRLQSNTYASVDNLTTRQGGYALFDALLAYRINSTLSLQLNANNLFDKVYYAKFSPNSRYFNNYYGDPRNLTLTLRANF